MNCGRQKCLVGSVFLWLIILAGCAEREPTKTTSQMGAEEQFWIRVLLLDDIREFRLKVESAFSVINAETKTVEARFDPLQVPTVAKLSGGRIVITGRRFASNEVIISPDKPYVFNLNGNDYRGKLKLVINSEGNCLDAINLVPLEPYLAGVVGAEMPNYWEPAALQAQAVAARTYCLYIKRHFGDRRSWDVRRTQANQVYLGVRAESAQVWDAVHRTWGEVLVCTYGDGTENIFPTYYSSTCGGHTENSKHVFGDSFEPLAGRDCPYCKDVVRRSFFFWPTTQFDKVDVTSKLFGR
jgi:stage II sporulation protein D